jgi:hypothetical protein
VSSLEGVEWSDLTWNDKIQLINTWNILIMVSNVIQFIGTFLFISKDNFDRNTVTFMFGIGCFLAWLTLTKYLMYYSEFSHSMRSFQIAGPLIIKGAIGIFPFFLGTAFLGLCIFSDSYRFSTLDLSIFTLYAMMNGDMIWDTYHDLHYFTLFFSCIFLYFFVFFSIS